MTPAVPSAGSPICGASPPLLSFCAYTPGSCTLNETLTSPIGTSVAVKLPSLWIGAIASWSPSP